MKDENLYFFSAYGLDANSKVISYIDGIEESGALFKKKNYKDYILIELMKSNEKVIDCNVIALNNIIVKDK